MPYAPSGSNRKERERGGESSNGNGNKELSFILFVVL
jgi:hypothetical protein